MSFTKQLVSTYPSGVNIVGEVDFYYPMYSTISELFPKDKKPTPATSPKPVVESNSMTMMANPKFDSISETYFDDGNIWRRKVR